jgi:hypothetical protein
MMTRAMVAKVIDFDLVILLTLLMMMTLVMMNDLAFGYLKSTMEVDLRMFVLMVGQLSQQRQHVQQRMAHVVYDEVLVYDNDEVHLRV